MPGVKQIVDTIGVDTYRAWQACFGFAVDGGTCSVYSDPLVLVAIFALFYSLFLEVKSHWLHIHLFFVVVVV